MGIAERRAREKEELRSKILEAAGELFVEEGIANVSLRKIADRIEYSPATIYLYFRDKSDLVGALCQEVFGPLKAELERIEASSPDPLEGLRTGLRFYIEFGVQHPHHYLLTFCTPRQQAELLERSPELVESHNTGLETFDCLRRSLRRCRDAGVLEFEDIEATSQAVWMAIHGITSLLISSHGDPHFPWMGQSLLIDTGLDMVVRGLRHC